MAVTLAGANVPQFWELMQRMFGDPTIPVPVADPSPDPAEAEFEGKGKGVGKGSSNKRPRSPEGEAGPSMDERSTKVIRVEGGELRPVPPPQIVTQELCTLADSVKVIPTGTKEEWASAGIPKQFIPVREGAAGSTSFTYPCRVCAYGVGNTATMLTHTRKCHLGVSLRCYICESYSIWSTGAWKIHMDKKHPGMPTCPAVKLESIGDSEAAEVAEMAGL